MSLLHALLLTGFVLLMILFIVSYNLWIIRDADKYEREIHDFYRKQGSGDRLR